MGDMFYCSKFDGDISQWDVSNVTDMRGMFMFSKFNRDIS
jgi:surface protein